MRELLLRTVTMEDDRGRVRSYEYSILVDELDTAAFSCESYGLKIEEKGSGHSCAIPHITTSADRIERLSELVVAGGVTPVTLRDVVLDWL